MINTFRPHSIAEIGVFRGELALHLLNNCKSIKTYFGIDPYVAYDNWNKPLSNDITLHLAEWEAKKALHEHIASGVFRFIRKPTVEVDDEIPDSTLDFVYVDGDHTLRGITIDLDWAWRKTTSTGIRRPSGWKDFIGRTLKGL